MQPHRVTYLTKAKHRHVTNYARYRDIEDAFVRRIADAVRGGGGRR